MDGWCRADRVRGPWDEEREREGRNHEAFTRRLEGVLGTLEFERWWEGAAASLRGVRGKVMRVYHDDEA